jgi:hypothetical protein
MLVLFLNPRRQAQHLLVNINEYARFCRMATSLLRTLDGVAWGYDVEQFSLIAGQSTALTIFQSLVICLAYRHYDP